MQDNRAVVITGAGGGVGALLVKRFLANGDTVVATDLGDEALGRVREEAGPDAALVTVAADISTEAGCEELAAAARERAGRVDVLVNCAGWFPITPFEEIAPQEWRRVLEVNLTGTYLATRALLPLMKGHGWGRVINFGSGSVFDGTRFQTHYVAAKAGVVGFSRSLAREVGEHGITVNVIAPGLTVTEPVRRAFPAEVLEAQRDGRALGRDEEPEDLVGPVFFLASPDSGFVTGQTLNVDGGNFMI